MEQTDHEVLIRIDERVAGLVEVVEEHLKENREDFKEVHSRINVIAGKQNWVLGIGTACGAIVGAVGIWLKDTFTGGS